METIQESIKAHFFGRKSILQDLVQGVLAPSQPLDFSLVGPKMIGKSRLLKYLASPEGPLKNPDLDHWRPEQFRDGENIFVGHYDCDWPDAKEHLTRFICNRMRLQLQEENEIKLNWNLVERATSPGQQIGQIVRQLNQQRIRVVLLLDNFDHVLLSNTITEDMINELRPLTNELGLVVAKEYPLHDLNLTLASSPLFNVMHQHFIGLLEPSFAREWVDKYSERLPFTPDVKEVLLELAGGHPFLLARINDIVVEMQPFVSENQQINEQHLPLIRLRLAEHGRPLFDTIWRKLQQKKGKAALPLVKQLINNPITMGQVPLEQISELNWLINQAIVIYNHNSYYLFSPLLQSYLVDILELEPSQAATVLSPKQDTAHYQNFISSLPPKEADLLRYFQAHNNQVIGFDQLLADVWDQPDASPRRVQEAIRRLRNSLNKEQPPIGTIENERGVGYRYVPAG